MIFSNNIIAQILLILNTQHIPYKCGKPQDSEVDFSLSVDTTGFYKKDKSKFTMDDKKAEAGMAPPTYNDAMYPKQPGSNPAMTQPFPPYPTQAGVAPYPTQPGQPAYPAGVSSCHQIAPHP